jgi:predicted alpha/beta-hydrolase family hydrolase
MTFIIAIDDTRHDLKKRKCASSGLLRSMALAGPMKALKLSTDCF